MLHKISLLTFVFLLLLGSGCARTVGLRFSGDANLNQSARHQSLPVCVKLYQLSSSSKFLSLDFLKLWQHDDVCLGKSLLQKKHITITPQSHSTLQWRLQKHAKYIGAVAIFRTPVLQRWQVIKKVPGFLSRSFLPLEFNLKQSRIY